MKAILKVLFILLSIISLAIGCNTDEPAAEVIITIDPSSTTVIPDEGIVNFKGNVKAISGTIDEISLIVLYRGKAKDKETGQMIIKDLTELAANVSSGTKEFTKKSKNEYEFYITEKNSVVVSHRTEIHGIRVNVRMKSGERFSKVWSIRAQYKI